MPSSECVLGGSIVSVLVPIISLFFSKHVKKKKCNNHFVLLLNRDLGRRFFLYKWVNIDGLCWTESERTTIWCGLRLWLLIKGQDLTTRLEMIPSLQWVQWRTLASPARLTYGIIDLLLNLSNFITRKKDLSFGISPAPRCSSQSAGHSKKLCTFTEC